MLTLCGQFKATEFFHNHVVPLSLSYGARRFVIRANLLPVHTPCPRRRRLPRLRRRPGTFVVCPPTSRTLISPLFLAPVACPAHRPSSSASARRPSPPPGRPPPPEPSSRSAGEQQPRNPKALPRRGRQPQQQDGGRRKAAGDIVCCHTRLWC